jgi:hypothetical protein
LFVALLTAVTAAGPGVARAAVPHLALGAGSGSGVARAAGRPRTVSVPGWRTALTRHYGAAGDASGFSAVVALSRTDAWAFGGTNPGGAGAPVALQWNGSSWRPRLLPAGLSDFIGSASASSARDVWAVSYAGGYVLHWNGSRWLVAKRWRRPDILTGVTAVSPSDVWVFGTANDGVRGLGSWHFDGRTWTQADGLAGQIYRASAVSARDIWAVAATRQGGYIEHYDGRSWQRVGAASPALAGLTLDAVLAQRGGGVWAAGNRWRRRGDGAVVIVHFNGRQWTRTSTSWPADTERLAPDGSGGVWITADNAGASGGSLIGHLSLDGELTWSPLQDGLASGISDVASGLGPGAGPGPVWLTGGYLTPAGGDAAIWSRLGGWRDEPEADG